MSSNQYRAIELAIIPRAGRLPSDIDALMTSAILGWCPVQSVAKRAQADHLAVLIDETLVEAGR